MVCTLVGCRRVHSQLTQRDGTRSLQPVSGGRAYAERTAPNTGLYISIPRRVMTTPRAAKKQLARMVLLGSPVYTHQISLT